MNNDTMKIKLKIALALVVFVWTGFGCQAQNRPNIVIILADDLGYGDVHCNNPEFGRIPTPNIDRLAGKGMRFTDGHSSSAVCSPSRYTLLTGRYHWRSRLQKGIVDMWEQPLINEDRLTIAGLARQAGYRTAAIGKWHLGWDWPIAEEDRLHFTNIGPFEGVTSGDRMLRSPATEEDRQAWERTFAKPLGGGPTKVGFDTYFGTDVPNWPPFCFIENNRTVGIPTELLAGGQVAINQASFQGPALKEWDLKQILPVLTKRATDFIAAHARDKQPFLLYFSLTSPHTPLAVTDEWKNKSGLKNAYADFVVQADDVVGRVLAQLTASGVEDNTVVMFLSDNGCGAYIGVKELAAQGHAVSGPFRGYKGDVWEGGHRTPFIIRYPGVTQPGSVCDELVLQADIMATLSEIFNTRLPDNAGEDSFSLLPLLKGSRKPIRESAIVCRWDGVQAIMYGHWKLIFTPEPELYNLASDVGETKNVAAENPELVTKMLTMRKKMVADGRSTPGSRQENDVEVKL